MHNLHSDLPLLPERMKIKCNKVVCTLYDKKTICSHQNLKTSIRAWFRTKKVCKAIAFCQEAWLKPYIDINTELRKKAKTDFEKDFYKLMNNAVFGITMENVRKHRDIKFIATDKKRSKLASMPNYDAKKWFSEVF